MSIHAMSIAVVMCVSGAAVSPQTDQQALLVATVQAIWQVESSGQLHPEPGDGGRAVGPLQIWRIRVDDVNRICQLWGLPGYAYEDREDLGKSVEMFTISSLFYEPNGGPEERSRSWNGGPGWRSKRAKTDGYWQRVRRHLGGRKSRERR
jgi:hypothetical protein